MSRFIQSTLSKAPALLEKDEGSMSVQTLSSQQAQTAKVSRSLIGGKTFNVVYFLAASLLVTGSYLDAWAHGHVPRLETFFTPWHGVLYSGVLSVLIVLGGTVIINRRRGAATWLDAIPLGYGASLLGVCGMCITGVGDGLWHTFFGIEQNIDALFSPTHLMAMICTTLIAIGPWRALYHRQKAAATPGSWSETLGLICASVLLLAMVYNFTQSTSYYVTFAVPLTAGPGRDTEQLMTILGYVFQAMLLTGFTMYLLRRWKPRFGFFTITLTLLAIPLSFMRDYSLAPVSALLAGLIIDIAYRALHPSLEQPLSLRIFAAITAAALPCTFLLVLRLTSGPLAWTIHMSVGAVIVSAALGWLLSYLMLPDRLASQE